MDAGGWPRTLRVSAGRGATRGRSGNVEGERLTGGQESVSLRHLRSDPTWENGSWHNGSSPFADMEGAGGSTPPAPTIPVLTSAYAKTQELLAPQGDSSSPHSGRRALYCSQITLLRCRSHSPPPSRARPAATGIATSGLVGHPWSVPLSGPQDLCTVAVLLPASSGSRWRDGCPSSCKAA